MKNNQTVKAFTKNDERIKKVREKDKKRIKKLPIKEK